MNSTFDSPMDVDPSPNPTAVRSRAIYSAESMEVDADTISLPTWGRTYAIYSSEPTEVDASPNSLPAQGRTSAIYMRPDSELVKNEATHFHSAHLDLYNATLASIHERLAHTSTSTNQDIRLQLDSTLTDTPLEVQPVVELIQQSSDLKHLSHLGNMVFTRWERTCSLNDLDVARSLFWRLIELLLDTHPNKPHKLYFFGHLSLTRFQLCNRLPDLEAAIYAYGHAIKIPSFENQPPATKYSCCFGLGLSLFCIYQAMKIPGFLDDSILAYHRALDFAPEDSDPGKRQVLDRIGSMLQRRFRLSGNLDDIDYAISAHDRAVELTPADDLYLADFLSNLGIACLRRYRASRRGEREYLERAIKAHCRAIQVLPAGTPLETRLFHNFGLALQDRGICIGSDDAQDDVDAYERAALYAQSTRLVDWPRIQAEYGKALVKRFIRLGQPLDIERAVEVYECIFEKLPRSYDDGILLNEMGVALQFRFESSEEWGDLMSALRAHERAVKIVPSRSPEKPRLLDSLAMTWQTRYVWAPEMEYIDSAILAHERAVELAPEGHPKKAIWISHLATSLRIRYDQSEDLSDLERAVSLHRQAQSLLSQTDPMYPELLNELGLSLLEHFKNAEEQNRDANDIVTAVEVHRNAVNFAPDDHPKRLMLRRNLGEALRQEFEHVTQNRAHFDEAKECFMEFAPNVPGFRAEHLTNAAACARMLTAHRDFCSQDDVMLAWNRFMDAFETEAAWLGHSVRRRFRGLSRWGKDVRNAVAAALESGKDLAAAEWLEAGRSLIWSQVLSLRDPIGVDIWERDAGLALELRQYTQSIQEDVYAPLSAAIPDRSFEDLKVQDIPRVLRNPRSLHRRRVLDYEAILEGIRQHEEFEDFRRRKSVHDLLRSAHAREHLDGYIVFLNVHKTRTDAIVVVPGDDFEIASTRLSLLTYNRAKSLANGWAKLLWDCAVIRQRAATPRELQHRTQVMFHNSLKGLWDWVVHPILQFIEAEGFLRKERHGRLPHITWCPSGKLTELPLHAAGDYSNPTGPRAYNYIVSSYTPSLSALVRSSEQASKKRASTSALIVTQPATPNHSALPFTEKERARLQTILSQAQIPSEVLVHENATVAAVSGAIDGHSWLHLACHGKQDWSDPTKSAFSLYDGPLSIPGLMRTAGDSAELAFLSACQTAKGDVSIKEEAAHLAAGVLAVGFCGVVGTMWSIGDADAPVVVEAFYTKLIEMRNQGTVGLGETGAAYALHEAVGRLRERVGEENFVKWAPFVHFGV
ncbi:hypothetical protein PENSPDRAFT_400810 [Peniophora sp. CONT]|nr:hypothetical protein PENSPDRAFT_400810 [Peniophora sp. CONT]